MRDDLWISRKFVLNVIVSVAILFLIYGFILFVSPFLLSIFLSIVFTVVFYPIYRLYLKTKINNTAASLVSTFTVLFIFVIPIFLFAWILFKEAKHIYPSIVENYNNMDLSKIKLPNFVPFSVYDIKDILTININEIQKQILKFGGSLIKNIFLLFVNLSVMFISMFFFFKDGKRILEYIIRIIPVSNENIEKILQRFEISVNSVIRGIILTAFIQGLVAMFGFYVAGLSSPALLGLFVMISALIPFLGTSTVTVPIILYCYFTKPIATTIFIFIWGFFVVGLVDNFIRPILIGNFSKMPIGLVFLGIVAGIKAFGPAGFIIGPIFVAVFVTIIEIISSNKKS